MVEVPRRAQASTRDRQHGRVSKVRNQSPHSNHEHLLLRMGKVSQHKSDAQARGGEGGGE